MKDFQKYWTRMKINEETQKKQSNQPRNKIVFNWFQKTQSVVYANQPIVFISSL